MRKKIIVLLLVCAFATTSINFTAFASTMLSVTLGNEFTIEDGGADTRSNPGVSALGDDVFVGINCAKDAVTTAHNQNMMKISRDDGSTWPTTIPPTEDFPPIQLIKLANGNLVGFTFEHWRTDATHSYFYKWTSTDNGASWTKSTASVTHPFEMLLLTNTPSRASFQNHHAILKLSDTSYIMTGYGRYTEDDTHQRVVLFKTTDSGASWTVLSTIAMGGYDETALVKCADGSLLCVMRSTSYYPLSQCRSLDGGLTWSVPTRLPGVDAGVTSSVFPNLVLLQNGTLALSYGRDYGRMLFSEDGCGYKWSNLTYTDMRRSNNKNTNASSNNYSIAEVSANKLLLAGDYGSSWCLPDDFRVWGKYVDVSENTVTGNKIDLRAKYLRGDLTVSTDMAYTDPAQPQMGMAGALDDDTGYNASAFKSGTAVPSYYTIALDKTYTITALGICLKKGYAESADIYFSTDGTNWGSPVKSYTNATHTAVDYTNLATPIQAKYVKVNITSAVGSPGLNQIELFSNPDNFDSDAVGSTPAGYTLSSGTASVSNTRAVSGSNSLRVYDDSTSAMTNITKTSTASKNKALEFKYYPVSAPTGNLFKILSGSTAAYQFLVTSTGDIKWYNGSKYNLLTDTNVTMNAWNTVRIVFGNASAEIYVNNVYAGMAGILNRTLNTFDTVAFLSGGTATTGDDYYIDDVWFDTDINEGEDTFEYFASGATQVEFDGYKKVSGTAEISSSQKYAGVQSMRVYDNSTSAISRIERSSGASNTKLLQFWIRRVATPTGALFDIMGDDGSTVYHLGLNSSGMPMYYNGSSWTNLTGAGNIPANTWTRITVDATMSSAKVYVNGTLAGTAGKWQTTANVMDGIGFSSGSTAGTGDDFYIDDVYFERGPYNDTDTFENDTVGSAPANYLTSGVASAVSHTRAVEGTNSLRVYDNSTSAQATISKYIGKSGSKTVEFDIYPAAVVSGACFTLRRDNTTLYYIDINSSGQLQYYNGSTWTVIGTAALNAWNHIKIEANTINAKVYLNGNAAGTITRSSNAYIDVDEIAFSSGGTAPSGDDFYVDNVFVNYND